MKKRMLFATVLASASALCSTTSALPVHALHCWGSETGEEFQNLTLLDDKGMFSRVASGQTGREVPYYEVYTATLEYDLEQPVYDPETNALVETVTEHIVRNPLYVVWPTENQISFVIRNGLDEVEATQKMLEILEQYYPGISEKETAGRLDPYILSGTFQFGTYTLYDNSEHAGDEDISDAVMHDLAKAGLISAFYTWGETAHYQEVKPERYLTAYIPAQYDDYNERNPDAKIEIDWDAVQTWTAEHHPECECRYVMPDETELLKKLLILHDHDGQPWRSYPDAPVLAIMPPENIPFAEHFAIAAELYAQFGIRIPCGIPEGNGGSMIGQNALAFAGDVTLDCAVDVSDAVLTARFCAGDSEAVITDQGKQNADMDGNGNIDIADVTAILKTIAKID